MRGSSSWGHRQLYSGPGLKARVAGTRRGGA